MADLWHEMGGDLALSATGDLLTVTGALATQQRVLRRLLTNPGAMIFHLAYGAGLGRFIGQAGADARIASTIRRQMKLERGVGAVPPPVVTVTADRAGDVTAIVQYADQATGLPQNVTVGV